MAITGGVAAAPAAYADHTAVLVVDFPRGSGDGEFESSPSLLDVGPTGMFAAMDWGNGRVQMLHPNGTHAFDLERPRHASSWPPYRGGFQFGPTGEIFAAGCDDICVFHPNGTYAYSFRTDDFLDNHYRSGDFAVGHDGLIVMLDLLRPYDRADRIVYIHPNGTLSHYAPLSVDNPGPYSSRFSVDPDGMVVVITNNPIFIHKFHPNGTLAATYDMWWMDRGHNTYPALAAGPADVLALYSYRTDRFYFIGPAGERLFSFDSLSDGHDIIESMNGMAFDPSGRLVVTESLRLIVLEIESLTAAAPSGPERQLPAGLARPGDHAQAYGSPGRPPLTGGAFAFEFGSYGEGPGEFLAPHNIAVGPGGAIAVSDAENDRIQLFHPNGTFAFELGSRGSGPGELIGPYGITFGPNGLLVVADVGNHRVQVFRIQ